MSLDSLLTIAGLLIAAYAIMPRDQWLNLKLRFGVLHGLIAIIAFLIVLYFQFYASFEKMGLTPNMDYERWGLTPEKISFIVILLSSLLIGLLVYRVKLTPSRVPRFYELTQELLWAEKYQDLALILERNLSELMQICKGKTIWLHWRTKLLMHKQPPIDQWLRTKIEKSEGKTEFQKLAGRLEFLDKDKELLAKFIPSREKEIEQANEFCIQVLTNKNFVDFIAKGRPYLGLDIIKADFYQREVFLQLYMTALLHDTSSVLYHEIRNNQNSIGGYRYEMYEENRILHTLVSDAKFAKKLNIYRPVGEYMKRQLDEQSLLTTKDPYNLPLHDFEEDKWTSPLWIGINFFDIMVTTALFEGIEWHMWLYYFVPITQRICKNYRLDNEQVDVEAELPTPYSSLLYDMFLAMTNWISALHEIPLDQPNVRLDTASNRIDNGNIPMSSILALSRCLKCVLVEQKIPVRFRQSLLTLILLLYFNLLTKEELYEYAKATRNAIGICAGFECRNRELYYQQLVDGIDRLDRVTFQPEEIEKLRDFVMTESIKKNSLVAEIGVGRAG